MQIILGAGFSAFFTYYFLKQKYSRIMLIGQRYQKFPYGVFFLENPKLEKIFKTLGLKYAKKKMKIGIKVSENKIVELTWQNLNLLKNYAEKVGKKLLEVNILNFLGRTRYIFNREKFIFLMYEYMSEDLFDTLEVIRVNPEESFIRIRNLAGFEKDIQYNFLVSTIPLPVFLKLVNIESPSKFLVRVPILEKDDLSSMEDFDVVYDSTSSDVLRYFPSWGLVELGPLQVVDFFEAHSKGKIIQDFDFSKITLPRNIKFIGRFAKWKKDYTLVDSLEAASSLIRRKYGDKYE